MNEIKPAEVICQFDLEGKIIPIKFKVVDEEQLKQTFTVKAYRQPSIYMKQYNSYLGRPYQTKTILDFDCKIEILGTEKMVRLRYFVDRMEWKVLY